MITPYPFIPIVVFFVIISGFGPNCCTTITHNWSLWHCRGARTHSGDAIITRECSCKVPGSSNYQEPPKWKHCFCCWVTPVGILDRNNSPRGSNERIYMTVNSSVKQHYGVSVMFLYFATFLLFPGGCYPTQRTRWDTPVSWSAKYKQNIVHAQMPIRCPHARINWLTTKERGGVNPATLGWF